MIEIVIVLLSVAIFGFPALVGYHVAAPIIANDFNTGFLISMGIVTGIVVIVYSLFMPRTDGRKGLVLWYSFDSPMMLAMGAAAAFIGALFLGKLAPAPAVIFCSIGIIFVVRAVMRGPAYGWEEFVTRRLRQ